MELRISFHSMPTPVLPMFFAIFVNGTFFFLSAYGTAYTSHLIHQENWSALPWKYGRNLITAHASTLDQATITPRLDGCKQNRTKQNKPWPAFLSL